MAAKPIERFVKKQIQEQGGWDRILERIASGETYTEIATTLKRPDGDGISFEFFRRLIRQDPARKPLLEEAKRVRAEAWADQAKYLSDTVKPDKDAVAKAKLAIDTRMRLASYADREQYGEKQAQVNVQFNADVLYLNALRHRAIADSEMAGVRQIASSQSATPVDQNDTRLTDTVSAVSDSPSAA